MHSRRSISFVRICLLATALCWAVPVFSLAAPSTSNQSDDPLTNLAKKAGKGANDLKNNFADLGNNKKQQDVLGIITAIIGLLVTTAPVLFKAYESLSLRAENRDLSRIQDLIALMEKTRKEKALTEATLNAVCAQIDLEILSTLESLERRREHHNEVLKKRQEALEKRKARQDPDLGFAGSAFLMFRPHGWRAWIAHPVAFLSAFLLVAAGANVVADHDYWGMWLTLSVISLGLFLLARTWALWERKRWKTAVATGIVPAGRTIFFLPHNVRTGLALVVTFLWFCLVVLVGVACVADPFLLILFIPLVVILLLCRKWALYERERWLKHHLPLETAPRVPRIETGGEAALPAGPR